MKKLLILIITLISFCLSNNPTNVYAEDKLILNGNNVIVMEVTTGRIIYSSNEHEKLYPASMTKMMGMYLILEGIEDGKISFEDQVICSFFASSMGGTQMYLEEGEKMKVEDLFKAVAINSCNDAIVALGEYLAGSNEEFVKLMNKKASELGMKNTNFINATGFDDINHYSTPYDMAIIGRRLVLDYPIVLEYSSLIEDYVKGERKEEFWLVNTNKLLSSCEGMDGLKTGFTFKAGYNLTSTVKRNGIRIITVVMNENSIKERSLDTIKLVNYAFSKLKIERLYEKDLEIAKYEFPNTLGGKVPLFLKENVDVVLLENENIESLKFKINIDYNNPPIEKEDTVGVLLIEYEDGTILKYPLVVKEKVEKRTFLKIWLNNIERIIN